ncbi:hypothetical protein [Roseateles sp. PN1]|uniref:hypothetical protein n=1 Tax=Roseateles sp. PN1 TaxID=3137372 RepID=UPI0031388FA6
MITEEMKNEAAGSSDFFAAQSIKKQQTVYISESGKELQPDHPKLSETRMNLDLERNGMNSDWRNGPRNFYDTTKNHETQRNFFFRHNLMNSGEYRAQFLGKDDRQVQLANDAVIREMTLKHKDELSKVDHQDRPTMEKLHAFERHHVDHKEKVDLQQYTTLQAQFDGEQKLKDLYKDFKASTMGYEQKATRTVEVQAAPEVKKDLSQAQPGQQEAQGQSQAEKAALAHKDAIAAIQERMAAMRPQNKPSLGLKMGM